MDGEITSRTLAARNQGGRHVFVGSNPGRIDPLIGKIVLRKLKVLRMNWNGRRQYYSN